MKSAQSRVEAAFKEKQKTTSPSWLKGSIEVGFIFQELDITNIFVFPVEALAFFLVRQCRNSLSAKRTLPTPFSELLATTPTPTVTCSA